MALTDPQGGSSACFLRIAVEFTPDWWVAPGCEVIVSLAAAAPWVLSYFLSMNLLLSW